MVERKEQRIGISSGPEKPGVFTKSLRRLTYDADGLWDIYRQEASFLPPRKDRARVLRLCRRAVNLLSHNSLHKGEEWLEACLSSKVGETDGNPVTLEQAVDGIRVRYIKPTDQEQALIRWQRCAGEPLLYKLPVRTIFEWLRLVKAPSLDELVGEGFSFDRIVRLKRDCGLTEDDLRRIIPPDRKTATIVVVNSAAAARIGDYLQSESRWISISGLASRLQVEPYIVTHAVQHLLKMNLLASQQVRTLTHDGRGTRQIAVEAQDLLEAYLKKKGQLPPELGWERWVKTDIPRGLIPLLRAGEYDGMLEQTGLSRTEMIDLLRRRRGQKYIDISDTASGVLRRMVEELQREQDFSANEDPDPEGYEG